VSNKSPSAKQRGFFYCSKSIRSKKIISIHMKSFRTEIENPLVEKDIIDLEKK